LVGGAVICAIGVDVLRHVDRRRDHLAVAALPLILGAHQLDESLVWWAKDGNVPHDVGTVATWIYMLIALVLLPLFVPLAVLLMEPTARRRWAMAPFVAIGAGVGAVLRAAMIRGPISVTEHPYHLAYSVRISYGWLVVALYVAAVCGALLFSGFRHVVWFGVVNLVAVVVIATLTVDGFASVWCAWAAATSAVIALKMRWQSGVRRPRTAGSTEPAGAT
ncbi:MAG: DUF6629 family protein, partial [Acidimicrobiales bacterium]